MALWDEGSVALLLVLCDQLRVVDSLALLLVLGAALFLNKFEGGILEHVLVFCLYVSKQNSHLVHCVVYRVIDGFIRCVAVLVT